MARGIARSLRSLGAGAMLWVCACSVPSYATGPRLSDDEAPRPRPRVAASGALRYDGDSRLVRHGIGWRRAEVPGRLEARLTELSDAGGRGVLLVATVHFGAPGFYRALGRALARCSTIFYEDARGVSAGRSEAPLAAPDGCVWQRDALRPQGDSRWRRADLDWEEIAERLRAVGVEPRRARAAVRARALTRYELHELAMARVEEPAELGEGDLDADQLDADRYAARFAGRRRADFALIYRRDDVVIAALRGALAELPPGSEAGPLALVYGAAHARDLERRLTRDLGFRRVASRWLEVCSLRRP